jgi:hypothetical protein
MSILGHSQVSLTLGTYSDLVPELAEHAAEQMAEALWPEVATKDQQRRRRAATGQEIQGL